MPMNKVYTYRDWGKRAAYLDLARIFLLFRFSLRILFLRHCKLNVLLAS